MRSVELDFRERMRCHHVGANAVAKVNGISGFYWVRYDIPAAAVNRQ
jgi:hypothetical protein